jgi:hypothetical protein
MVAAVEKVTMIGGGGWMTDAAAPATGDASRATARLVTISILHAVDGCD